MQVRRDPSMATGGGRVSAMSQDHVTGKLGPGWVGGRTVGPVPEITAKVLIGNERIGQVDPVRRL